MKNFKIISCLMGLAILVALGFYATHQFNRPDKVEPVIVGAVLPLTGPSAEQGQAIYDGLKWKIDELNKQGANYKLVAEDSKSDPKEGVLAFSRLTDINHAQIVFSHLSSVSLAIKPLAEEKHILLWAYSAHPDTTKNSNYVLKHAYDTTENAEGLITSIKNEGYRSVGIIYQQDDYGVSFKDSLVKNLAATEIKVVTEGIDNKQVDFRTQLIKVNSQKPEAIVFIALGKVSGILVKQAKELNTQAVIYSSPGLIVSPDAVVVAGESLKGTFYQANVFDPREDNIFAGEYEKRFGKKVHLSTSLGYTDMEIVDAAIGKVGLNPLKLVNYVKSLSSFQGTYEKVLIKPTGEIIIPTAVKVWGNR